MKTRFTILIAVAATGIVTRVQSQCGTFTSNVPYAASFNTFTANNQLPVCWSASHLGSANVTFSGSSGYAAFTNTPAGTSYFFSNGIQLYPSVTYSAYMFYTSIVSSPSFYSLGIALGASQNSVGMTPIVTTTNVGPPGSILGNTFTVPSSGIYYLGIWAASSGTSTQMLKWTDVYVEIPCSFAGNSPTIIISPPSTNVCPNETYTLVASGAHQYNWGSTATLVANTASSIVQNIIGTNTTTGCMTLLTYPINVKPVPQLTVSASNTIVCPATVVTLTVQASSSSSFQWQGGQTGTTAQYSPSVQSTFSVFATAANGCTNTTSRTISVYNSPTIGINSNRNQICIGESASLTATGGTSYAWSATGFSSNVNPAVFTGSASNVGVNTITAVGTDTNGCTSSEAATLTVNACTTIKQIKNEFQVSVYPQPASDFIMLDNLPLRRGNCQVIAVNNLGQVMVNEDISEGKAKVSVTTLVNGQYLLFVYQKNKLIYSNQLLISR